MSEEKYFELLEDGELFSYINELQQENQQLKGTLETISNFLVKYYTVENQYYFDHIQDIIKER